MSSAAVQSYQQPATQYQQSPSATRDAYPPEQSPDLSISPASSRRQPKYVAGNGAPPNTPQSLGQPFSPAVSSVTTPREQRASSTNVTPASRQTTSTRDASYYSDRQTPQTSLPIRQAQHNAAAASAGSSPYVDKNTPTRSSLPFTPDLAQELDKDRSRENAGSTPGLGSRKKDRTPSEGTPHTHDERSGQRQHHSPVQSRSTTAVGQPPVDTSLPREDSAVLNRVVVADPQEDIEREQARIAESQPAPAPTVSSHVTPVTGLGLVGSEGVEDGGRGGHQRSRQEHLKNSQPRRETRFGEYILGQTIGEGEFGKVKMGWKKEGGVQVAIKLIRRDTLGNNPNRLPKIYREISILRGLQHPNIVRLHEMVETERHIGIILEYASGGELFDYILNHRYLKDNAARRLFAQLVSGVGYLHRKGIVHRDLKLENLLLDRNRNIIITDFGFANTFNPVDELGDEIEYNLSNKEFVQKMGLEQIQADGHRRGDLMQTSCGSPCYAAPELVVSDSLYTGRKVDVWSCGVILYAMLAGYLPFDDDPANPEGDNINLLYKYIVSTPLTFPEYVTPHARDLLRRILVPDPRKRADLFEVARHSWLSEYAHVVGFITSSATIAETGEGLLTPEEPMQSSGLARSASVREPVKSPTQDASGFSRTVPTSSVAVYPERPAKTSRDAKRSTVQVEYVAPQSQTARGDSVSGPPTGTLQLSPVPGSQSKTRAVPDTARPVEVSPAAQAAAASTNPSRPTQSTMPPPAARPNRDLPRAVSDSSAFVGSPTSSARPSTRGSITGATRLPSRGNSYSQPVAATVAQTNVEGRFSQPAKSGYMVAGSLPQDNWGRDPSSGRPLSQQIPASFQVRPSVDQERPKHGHRRTSTLENLTTRIFGRSNSTRRQSQHNGTTPTRPERPSRAYPPVSMQNSNSMAATDTDAPRPSTDSRRPSFSFSRRTNNDDPSKRSSKRFSFLPSAFSRMSLSGYPKDPAEESSIESKQAPPPPQQNHRRQESKGASGMAFGRGRSKSPSADRSGSANPGQYDSAIEGRNRRPPPAHGPQRGVTAPDLTTFSSAGSDQYPQQQYYPQQQQQQYHQRQYSQYNSQQGPPPPAKDGQYQQQAQPSGYNGYENSGRQGQRLQKNNRKFAEAYDGAGSGSNGGARRVMDWFRKRGRERTS